MGQKITGGALALTGFVLYGFAALDAMGLYSTRGVPIFVTYGFLLVFLGIGVHSGDLHFEQESAWKYEGLIFIFALGTVIMMVGTLFISLS